MKLPACRIVHATTHCCAGDGSLESWPQVEQQLWGRPQELLLLLCLLGRGLHGRHSVKRFSAECLGDVLDTLRLGMVGKQGAWMTWWTPIHNKPSRVLLQLCSRPPWLCAGTTASNCHQARWYSASWPISKINNQTINMYPWHTRAWHTTTLNVPSCVLEPPPPTEKVVSLAVTEMQRRMML